MRLCAVGTALILLVALGAPPPCEAGPGNWLQAAGRIGGALVRAWNGKNDSKKLDGSFKSKLSSTRRSTGAITSKWEQARKIEELAASLKKKTSMTKTHGLLKLKASSADDSAELTLLPVLTFSANGSAPLCYNITSDEFEEISLFVPNYQGVYKEFAEYGKERVDGYDGVLPEFDFCSTDEDPLASAFGDFVVSIFGGGSVAAHAATALAYAENVECPQQGVAERFVATLDAIDWNQQGLSAEQVALFFQILTSAFDRSGMGLCVLLLNDLGSEGLEILDYQATGALVLPTILYSNGTQLKPTGKPIDTVKTASEYSCDYLCWITEACWAWSYETTSNDCNLLDAVAWTATKQASSNAAVLLDILPAGFDESGIEEDKVSKGELLLPTSAFESDDPYLCGLACAYTPACFSWTLLDGVCSLQKPVEQGDLVPQANAYAGAFTPVFI